MRNNSSTTGSEARRGGRLRVAGAVALAALVAVVGILAVQQLLAPKYMDSLHEGAMLAEYYSGEKNHDVIFIGDCEAYDNFSPITLWEEYGIASYIRGGPEQLMWQSYYVLRDTLYYEKPKVVVLNVLAMMSGTPSSEAYNRLNLDGLRLSPAKIAAIKASMTGDEMLLTYLFPLLRYHDRWSELSAEDIKYYFKKAKVTHNGYYMRNDVKPVTIIPEGPKLPDYRFPDICYGYLDKIRELCEENDIELILVKAPSIYPHWYEEWDGQARAYADSHGLVYINYLEIADDIGLDFETDTYDAGLHMNRAGAEKVSRHLGGILRDEFGLADKRADAALAAAWDEKVGAYYEMAEAQLRDIELYGEVRTFIYENSRTAKER